MNTLYVILFVLVAYTNAKNESNFTMSLFAGNTVSECYYCTNCPRPFNRFDRNVTKVSSDTIWCTKMGSSNSTKGDYARGIAWSSLCSSNGCTWQYIGGALTYFCCCNHRLCNTGVSTSQSIAAVLSTAFITTVAALKGF